MNNAKALQIAKTLTNIVNWRQEGLYYKKNEVYLDVIEKIDSNANVLRSEVIGQVRIKCFLSGMPSLKLGLNDKVLFELTGRATRNRTVDIDDLKFHQCVDINKFEADRSIEFIPPDGEFDLINYRLDIQLKPLIWVEVLVEHTSTTRIEYTVRAKSNYKSRSIANNVDIFIPVPNDLQNAQFKTQTGTVRYLADQEDLQWNIKQLEGQHEIGMKCYFVVPTVRIDDPNRHMRRPITVRFDIPYFTVSGIQVRYLKISEKSDYNAMPWVRYITQNGDYQLRMI